jgi:stearoyl-CoA desaturase (delta-9 desaturase)
VLALLTWGEGYHNFHHLFQNDYRNGIRWWQYDLTKWFINACRLTGLASGLRRVPKFRILRARLTMEFIRAERKVQGSPLDQNWKTLIEQEYTQFKNTIQEWQELQAERANEVSEKLISRWQKTVFHTHVKELEYRLKMQRRRLALISVSLVK